MGAVPLTVRRWSLCAAPLSVTVHHMPSSIGQRSAICCMMSAVCVDCYLLILHVQICLALHYVHAAGVLHRDLKTSNVLITSNPNFGGMPLLKLGDFGVAKINSAGEKLRGLLLVYATVLITATCLIDCSGSCLQGCHCCCRATAHTAATCC